MARRDGTLGYYVAFIALVAGLGNRRQPRVTCSSSDRSPSPPGSRFPNRSPTTAPSGSGPGLLPFEVTNHPATSGRVRLPRPGSPRPIRSRSSRTGNLARAGPRAWADGLGLGQVTPLETDTVRAPSLRVRSTLHLTSGRQQGQEHHGRLGRLERVRGPRRHVEPPARPGVVGIAVDDEPHPPGHDLDDRLLAAMCSVSPRPVEPKIVTSSPSPRWSTFDTTAPGLDWIAAAGSSIVV